jgi:hypothetical protein
MDIRFNRRVNSASSGLEAQRDPAAAGKKIKDPRRRPACKTHQFSSSGGPP